MKKLAVVSTVWFPLSHTDVIVTRWLEPNPARDAPWGFSGKETQIASVYLAQRPATSGATVPEEEWRTRWHPEPLEIGAILCERHGVPLYDTIEGALTLGTDSLAVDGVLLIGEHGEYPTNEFWQKCYPRKEFFDAIVAVFEKAGRVVPLFCDKHFSYDPEATRQMWQVIQDKEIPWLAGSSAPLVGFRHEGLGQKVAPPVGEALIEGVATFNVGPEVYGFHSLEVAQAVLEKRPGGEAGVAAITAFSGEAVFTALEEGRIPGDLSSMPLSVPRA
jgi:hypothetical protein